MNDARTRRDRGRRGTVLLQSVLVVFALMGLGALVVDLGIVRSTQRSLQIAADAAAIEGLRGRDALAIPADSDLARRTAASRVAALVFDEDADTATPPDRLRLGAGPTLATNVAPAPGPPAGGLLTDGGPYLPNLELNAGNAEVGDLVAGTYAALDPSDPGNPDWHAENALYLRDDFAPASAGDAPSAPAFLARLRRTNDTLELDRIPGVSSAAPRCRSCSGSAAS